MKLESLRDLYVEQLQDLYNAEQQLIKALPKMARAASSEELKAAFEDHLGQTRQHAQRIETIFEQMGEKAKGKKCKVWSKKAAKSSRKIWTMASKMQLLSPRHSASNIMKLRAMVACVHTRRD